MILVLDNYDSFTYNLVQYLGELGARMHVVRNDKITIPEVERLKPERIVISPGPGNPDGAGRKQMHGKTSRIHHDSRGVFADLPQDFEATRYHSLVVLDQDFPADLEISARAEDGEIMGLRHRRFPVEGVQFHPESILTGQGKALLRNFLGLPRHAAAA